jgi:hypothetical protein
MKRTFLLVPVFAVLLALLPSTAIASTLYQETVFGIETGTPTACGANSLSSFAGIARGTLNGGFAIAVCHTPLAPSATIVGGTFVLSNSATTVTGTFAFGGTVSYVSTVVIGSLCIQKFTVSGDLLPPPGHFAGKLLHYGAWSGTSCNVLFATISGGAQITG